MKDSQKRKVLSLELGLPDFPRRNTGDFCPSIHPSPVRPMCRYIIPRMLPPGHKLHTSSEYYWNCNKTEINPSLCSASSTRLKHYIARICCWAPCCGPGCNAAAAGRPALSINIFCAYGAQQQTRRTPLLRSTDGTDWLTDRRADGRTPDRFIDPAPHIMRAVSKSESGS